MFWETDRNVSKRQIKQIKRKEIIKTLNMKRGILIMLLSAIVGGATAYGVVRLMSHDNV